MFTHSRARRDMEPRRVVHYAYWEVSLKEKLFAHTGTSSSRFSPQVRPTVPKASSPAITVIQAQAAQEFQWGHHKMLPGTRLSMRWLQMFPECKGTSVNVNKSEQMIQTYIKEFGKSCSKLLLFT